VAAADAATLLQRDFQSPQEGESFCAIRRWLRQLFYEQEDWIYTSRGKFSRTARLVIAVSCMR
jgi:hypothetical protein